MTAPPPTDLDIARHVCTPGELQAFQLNQKGMGTRAIALTLGVSRSTIRSRIENAQRKITAARKDEAA